MKEEIFEAGFKMDLYLNEPFPIRKQKFTGIMIWKEDKKGDFTLIKQIKLPEKLVKNLIKSYRKYWDLKDKEEDDRIDKETDYIR